MTEEAPIETTLPSHFDWALWRRFIGHALPYRRILVRMCAAGIVVAAVDALLPVVTGHMLDIALTGHYPVGWATLYFVGLVVIGLGIVGFIAWVGQVVTALAYDLRRQGFARLQHLPFAYYDTHNTGWLVTRLTSDIEKVSETLPWFLFDLVWGSCMMLVSIVTMLWLDRSLAAVVLTIVPCLVLVSWWFQNRLLRSARAMRKTNSEITANYHESIAGISTTKSLTREDAATRDFSRLAQRMHHYSLRNALQSALYMPIIMTLSSTAVALALWRSGIELQHGLTFGELITFMQYARLLSTPIQDLARQFANLPSAQAAAERVQSLLDEIPAIQDHPEVLQRIAQTARKIHAPELALDGYPNRIETLAFEHVSFEYTPGTPVLSNVHLQARRGQMIAFIGPTGAGKSTIVNLAARFYEPTKGRITVDGIDLRDRSLHWLQSNLGVVLQTPYLFSGSIAENIRYGRLDASPRELEQAAKAVRAHDFITTFPDGYNTNVGEGGSRLSTGQRQLIALARAYLADPQILIMDEATSSVDTETESLIQAASQTLFEGRLVFVIAHRLSTIRRADLIVVIDQGRIVERGQHDDLLARNGRYTELYTLDIAQQSRISGA